MSAPTDQTRGVSITRDLTPLIADLARQGEEQVHAKLKLPASVDDGLTGKLEGFVADQSGKWQVKLDKTFDVEHDYYTLTGNARLVRAIFVGIDVLLNGEQVHSFPVEAGLLTRGRAKREIASAAVQLGVDCRVEEYKSLLDSTLIFHLRGATADVAALVSAVKDWDASMNGRPTLAQRRQRLLKNQQLGV